MVDYARYRERAWFTLELEVVTPMHIGSGFLIERGDGKDNKQTNIAALLLDAEGRPYLPSSTMRGALRDLALGTEPTDNKQDDLVKTLFGKAESDTGTMGLVAFSDARRRAHETPPNLGQRIDAFKQGGRGTILANRTRIDDARGVAKDGMLFSQEMIAPKTTFASDVMVFGEAAIELRARCEGETGEAPLADLLLGLFKTVLDNGIVTGRMKGDGYGRIALARNKNGDPDVSDIQYISIPEGQNTPGSICRTRLVRALEAASPIKASQHEFQMTLESATAFAVAHDTPGKGEEKKQEKGEGAVIWALRNAKGEAELPPSSLMGALRSKFRWWVKLKECRKEGSEGLTAAESRLFGSDENTKPRAGILRLQSITGTGGEHAEPRRLHSVRIDRFTQGPVDTALFSVEAFVHPQFDISFFFDRRARTSDRDIAHAFFEWLASDDLSAGLELGFGRNRGFGRFKVQIRDSGARANE